MKIYSKKWIMLLFASIGLTACLFDDYPVDEDGLLITDRAECYVSDFELIGVDFVTVLVERAVIDTVLCTIHADIKWGTDLKNLYPQFSLVTDAKLEPKITGITDFSDLEHPRQYTVISGNRKVRKTYTVYIAVQEGVSP
ncbi:MAG: hypothetical protein LBR10_00300 [Prevotellaceae bacterium]|jgi:hypothetical protein|nr:hypothetical protein [Prevotellaceae bacterium]